MAIAILTIKLDETKFKVKSILEMTNEETEVYITSVYIEKYDILPFLSKNTIKRLHKEIINQIC